MWIFESYEIELLVRKILTTGCIWGKNKETNITGITGYRKNLEGKIE